MSLLALFLFFNVVHCIRDVTDNFNKSTELQSAVTGKEILDRSANGVGLYFNKMLDALIEKAKNDFSTELELYFPDFHFLFRAKYEAFIPSKINFNNETVPGLLFFRSIAIQPGSRGDCRKILDKLIAKATNDFGSQLDPHSLPDFQFKFTWRFVGDAYSGQINLNKGLIGGLLPLKRIGNCIMEFPDDKVKMTTNFTMEKLRWKYASKLIFHINTTPLTLVHGKIGRISLELNSEINKDAMIIKELTIYEMEDIEIEIDNIRIIRKQIKLMKEALLKFFKTRIKQAIEIYLREFIEKEIKSVNLIKFIIESLKP